MPRIEEIQLHPWNWESDPEQEFFKLSTFDFLSTTTYTNGALFFRVRDSDKTKAVTILREGLERTLSQIRQYVGTIERDGHGGYAIVRKRSSTVRFVTQHLDYPGDTYPSFDEIAKAHFLSPILGDINVLSNLPMTCGNKPEAQPENSPEISSFKVNLIPGGIIFNIHTHHWCNGLTGGTAFQVQIAANCYAITHGTAFPTFNPKWLHRDLYGLPGFDRSTSSDGPQAKVPPRAQKNSHHRPSSALMFHLPKSKALELKLAATPTDGQRISTYNAICALIWRVTCKLREPLYRPGLDYKPLWCEGVSFAKLFKDPPLPLQLQGNLQFDVTSWTSKVPQLTLREIISEAPLSALAVYTRQMTDSVTVEMLHERMRQYQRIVNQKDLSINVDSFPPLSLLLSDWRYMNICANDWGFGKASAYRHLFGGVPLSQAIIYPPRVGPKGEDEGCEVYFTIETELVPRLLEDPELSRYFELRGVDAAEVEVVKSKL